MHQVEREIGKAFRLPPNDCVLQGVDMGDAAVVGNGNLAVDRHGVPDAAERVGERRPERDGSIEAVAGHQP